MKAARIAWIGGLVLLLAVVFVWLFQRRLLYFPLPTNLEQENLEAAKLGMQAWQVNGHFAGWRPATPTEPKLPRARVLVLHGNAGDALGRAYYQPALAPLSLEVILLEYPGYGPRPGSPSRQSLTDAALEAVEALAAEKAPVWLVGESLGTGVAGRVAALKPDLVRAMLLITPYADLGAVAHIHFPLLPAFMLRDRLIPSRDLAAFRRPVAVLVAGADEVVTADQGRQLFAALPGPKLLREQPQATHNGLDLRPGLPWWKEIIDFLDQP